MFAIHALKRLTESRFGWKSCTPLQGGGRGEWESKGGSESRAPLHREEGGGAKSPSDKDVKEN